MARTLVGASGIVRGVVAAEGIDSSEFPAVFIANTVNVYEVPFVKPVNVQFNKLVLIHAAGAVTNGDEITV